MAGCRSCSDCSSRTAYTHIGKAEKLEKVETSGNPRYPHIFVGKQAIYSEEGVQMIVLVLEDCCDENCDGFTLKPQRILKNEHAQFMSSEPFDVSQPVGDERWTLRALI